MTKSNSRRENEAVVFGREIVGCDEGGLAVGYGVRGWFVGPGGGRGEVRGGLQHKIRSYCWPGEDNVSVGVESGFELWRGDAVKGHNAVSWHWYRGGSIYD